MKTLVIICALVTAAYLWKFIKTVINGNRPSLSDVLICIIGLVLVANFRFSDGQYREGYNDAIHEAELVNVTDTGYFIDFNGEVHEYTFDR